DIFHPHIRKIKQVTSLGSEIGRIDLLSSIGGTWIEGIWVLGCPVIQLVGKPSFSGSVTRDEDRSVGPEVPFAYPLYEKVEVKAFEVATYSQRILVAGGRVADHLLVTVIINGIGSKIHHAVTVKIFVFDITRTEEEPSAFKYGLGRNTFFKYIFPVVQHKVAVGILDKIIFCKQSVSLITPNFAQHTTWSVGVDASVVGKLGDFFLKIR